MDNTALIDLPIASLGLSKSFVERSLLMGFGTLRQAIEKGPQRLLEDENFSYHWLAELSSFLEEKGLLEHLQPLPGAGR
ncbi:hypothetical protein [Mucilaginibacter pedocola]|uniref:RNA polymerase alpha subunit C-terminal domain-containing protein n=1 Tax=Mucilaginibacter pedocola TaxID=1792845 RepID=A0A1S9PGF4_9SPHI|nr:hypothetical protein [Mucilaginibacter pedocola]OOQ59987.1 hypothetical protein BC343_27030 [Mucilaginibacter pedocola]